MATFFSSLAVIKMEVSSKKEWDSLFHPVPVLLFTVLSQPGQPSILWDRGVSGTPPRSLVVVVVVVASGRVDPGLLAANPIQSPRPPERFPLPCLRVDDWVDMMNHVRENMLQSSVPFPFPLFSFCAPLEPNPSGCTMCRRRE